MTDLARWGLTCQDTFYKEEAPGWVDGVYYPREARITPGEFFLERQDGVLKLHSRVWQEIEETGFGVYYYEETTRMSGNFSGGNYLVRTVLANPTKEPYSCHIRVNGIPKAEAVTVMPGEEKETCVTACVTDGSLTLTFAAGALSEIHGQVLEGDVYLKDLKLEEEALKQKREVPRIFLVSDSTVQSYEKQFYPQTGWGQVLCRFFQGAENCREYPAEHSTYKLARAYELPGVVIENRSIGGRSARSFYDEGKLDQVLEIICPGDYMFVQFAHNDATAIRPNRYIPPEEFPFYIQRYIDGCKRRGACCVLVTPVTMRVLDEAGRNIICFAAYREQILKLAREQDIPVLDLSERSTAYLNRIGAEESKRLYMWLEEGEYPEGAYAGGVSDKCHLQEYGAKVYADMVAQMIAEYDRDGRLDELKKLVRPVPVETIEKPVRRIRAAEKPAQAEEVRERTELSGGTENGAPAGTDKAAKAAEATTTAAGVEISGFVAQEISVENGRGSFLLNWSPVQGAAAYRVYARKKGGAAFEMVRTVTGEEKEKFATLPFTAEAGFIWQYYVTAVFENGVENHTSRRIEVDLT